MIVVKMWGGLGNQLFQFAFGYAMAKKYQEELYLDISFYKKHQYKYVGYREFELDNLMCPIDIKDDLPLSIRFIESFVVNRIIRRWKGTISFSLGDVNYVKEKKHIFMTDVPYKKEKLNYYDGYWQSGLYFDDYKAELDELFKPNIEIPKEVKEFLELIKETDNSVSVHIRKGDFGGKIGYAVENEYYLRAIDYIKQNIDNPEFFVFSDDVSWVKDNIPFGQEPHFVNYKVDNGAIMDLLCMSKCKHGIMSASTFSWWGNWNKEGVVIVPSGEHSNNRFSSDEWIKI